MRNLSLFASLTMALLLALSSSMAAEVPKGPATGIVCWKNSHAFSR